MDQISKKVERFIEHMNRILEARQMSKSDYDKGIREIHQWADAKRLALTQKTRKGQNHEQA
jgi:hypothetical protein